jgi:mono/diheme cytochrome c family protein
VTPPARVRGVGWRPAATAGVLAISGFVVACGSTNSAPPGQATGSAEPNGADIYAASCSSCHGEDLRGTDKGPSHLSIVYEPNHHGDDSFRSAIANGAPQHHWSFGDMEPVEGLSEAQVDAVIAFVRDEQQRLGFEH